MFCLNSKKNDEDLKRKEIEKFENERNYRTGLFAILILLAIIIFCLYYFKPFGLFQKTQPTVVPIVNKSAFKSFGPDDIISPLLTSSSETSSLK
jgi:hypothetical protein